MHRTLNCAIQSFHLLWWSGVPGSLQYIIKIWIFSLTLKANWDKPIHEKKMFHLLNLKELHLEHISALSHAGISLRSIKLTLLPHPMRHLGITSVGINVVLKM